MRMDLTKCMGRNQLVELMYMDSKGSVSQRKVKILKIKGAIIQVFCFKRNAKRTFLIDNVLACFPVNHEQRTIV